MEIKLILFFILCFMNVVISSFSNNNVNLNSIDDDDPSEPLFLTPYIKSNQTAIAKQLAKVEHHQFGDVISYSGFLTVNDSFNSNLFFWFIQSNFDWKNAPIILWLQGGPGASSLFGLFTENGPFQIKTKSKVGPRMYSWHFRHNLIYIDNPVGSGFSFTDTDAGYAKNEEDIAVNLYSALSQFFLLFPELQSNKFFATGESYGGKYIPAISYYIHKKNQLPESKKINLQGIAIGNGLCDPINQLKYGDYLYQHGLIDLNGLKLFHDIEHQMVQLITQEEYEKAFEILNNLIGYDTDTSFYANLTGFTNHFSYIDQSSDRITEYLSTFIQTADIRKAIHVGKKNFNTYFEQTNIVLNHLKGDIMKSVKDWIIELLAYYPVILYNGQLDVICAYPLTTNFLQNLNFSAQEEYKVAKRRIWKVDKEIAGYVKQAGNLTEILVRNAGHMVPTDQPKWALDIILRLTSGKPFK